MFVRDARTGDQPEVVAETPRGFAERRLARPARLVQNFSKKHRGAYIDVDLPGIDLMEIIGSSHPLDDIAGVGEPGFHRLLIGLVPYLRQLSIVIKVVGVAVTV